MVDPKKIKNIFKYSSFIEILNNSNIIFAKDNEKPSTGCCNFEKNDDKKKKKEEGKQNPQIDPQKQQLINECNNLITQIKELDFNYGKTIDGKDTVEKLTNFKTELQNDLNSLKNKPKEKPEEKDKNPKKDNPENPGNPGNPVNPGNHKEEKPKDTDPKKDTDHKEEKDPKEKEKEEFDECVKLLQNSYDFSKKISALYNVHEEQLDNEIQKLQPVYNKIIEFEKKLKNEGKNEILNDKGKISINRKDLKYHLERYHLLDTIKDDIRKAKEEKAKKAKEEDEKKAKEDAFKKHIENLRNNKDVEKNLDNFFKSFKEKISEIYDYDYIISEYDKNYYIKLFKEKVMAYFEEEYKIRNNEDFEKYLKRIEYYASKFFKEYDNNEILYNYNFINGMFLTGSYSDFNSVFNDYIKQNTGGIYNRNKK